jgi:toxin HigB-1
MRLTRFLVMMIYGLLARGIHKLTGELKDFWSIKVSANYRITFRLEAGNIHEVDYLDYH